MTEYWTPEEQGKIAETAARLRQDGTIVARYVAGIGHVCPDGSVVIGESRLHVTFTTEEHIDLMPNTGHKERVAADKAAGKSPFARLGEAQAIDKGGQKSV